MPLIKIENISPECIWGLWEINESVEFLNVQLNDEMDFQKIKSIKNDLKKRESLAARLIIKKLLENLGQVYRGIDCDENGKPFLINSNLGISLSHSHGLATGIIYKNPKIGIDIEMINEKIRNIAFRVFQKEEIGENEAEIEKLVALWCIKEVLYKAHGQRKLDFRENIHIKPFDYNKEGGISRGEIRTNEGIETFNIKYQRVKDHIIAYNLPQKI